MIVMLKQCMILVHKIIVRLIKRRALQHTKYVCKNCIMAKKESAS